MLFGALIAGVIAALRSTDPAASGLRAGFIGGGVAVFTLAMRVVSTAVSGTAAAWPLSRIAFWIVASGIVLCVAPIFGLVCGRVGGGLTNTVLFRLLTGTTES